MDKEKLRKDERFLRIHFIDNELIIDVNDEYYWEKILNQKDKILKIETLEWSWNFLTGEVVFQ